MQRIVAFLKKSQTQYLATIGTDGKPKVRPFQFKLEDGGKLYFSTTNDKQVYKEIVQHPHVELCACGENRSWLRLSGKVVFSQDRSIKSRIIEEAIPLIKAVYKTPTIRYGRFSISTKPRRRSPISAAIPRRRSGCEARSHGVESPVMASCRPRVV
jgi:uncharacterized pyridoxamine 5'-phosphate oxidase family protein